MKKILCILLSSILLVNIIGDDTVVYTGTKQYEMLPLLSMDFATVKKLCKPLMSPKGIIVFEKSRNSILIYDYPEVIKQVQSFLAKMDAPRQMIRVEIKKKETQYNKKDFNNIRFGDKDSSGSLRIVNGRIPKDISFNFGRQRSNTSGLSSSFIVTQSGMEATIFSGRELANPVFFDYMNLYPPKTIIMRDGRVLECPSYWPEIEIIKIGIIFVMKPTLLANGMINVELYPQFKELGKDGDISHIKLQSLSTTVTIPQGREIRIGGAIKSKVREYSNLFGPDFMGGDENSSIMDMYIKASVVDKSNQRLGHGTIPRCR